MKDNNWKDTVVGISPLGGNSVEGTAPGMSPIRDERVQEVPLFYDDRVGQYISEQAVDELDDRDASEQQSFFFQQEEEFRAKAGYRRG